MGSAQGWCLRTLGEGYRLRRLDGDPTNDFPDHIVRLQHRDIFRSGVANFSRQADKGGPPDTSSSRSTTASTCWSGDWGAR